MTLAVSQRKLHQKLPIFQWTECSIVFSRIILHLILVLTRIVCDLLGGQCRSSGSLRCVDLIVSQLIKNKNITERSRIKGHDT